MAGMCVGDQQLWRQPSADGRADHLDDGDTRPKG
jgi:hypothetical protein